MPKCKNGMVVLSRFKAQGFLRRKYHLDLHTKQFLQGGTLRKLLLHRIFSKFEDKIFFSSEKLIGRF
jgi:hypothetical protein